jgi:hypothetical protein
MAELDIVHMQQCAEPWYCTKNNPTDGEMGCWPYRKSNNGKRFEYGSCKHVCQWHQQFSDEVQTEEQKKNHICPRCGGKTEVVRVGV